MRLSRVITRSRLHSPHLFYREAELAYRRNERSRVISEENLLQVATLESGLRKTTEVSGREVSSAHS